MKTPDPFRLLQQMRREAKAKGQPFRMGDFVAALASPAASAIDTHLGTDLTNCGGCAAEKARLNGQGGGSEI